MKKLIDKFGEYSDREAIVHKDRRFTYGALLEQIKEYSIELRKLNIDPGDVVIIYGDYSFYTVAFLLALVINKNVIVPITDSTPEHELKERIVASSADCCFHFKENAFQLEVFSTCEKHTLIKKLKNENKSGLILFSSGSTGKPKAMIHDFDNLISSYLDRKSRQLRFLVFLLFDHIGGVNTLLNSLSMGAVIIIPEKRDPHYICQLIEKYKVEILPGSPTFLNLMLLALSEKDYDFSSLKLITYGTEPMPESLLTRLKNRMGNVRLLQTFGTSETGIAKTSSKSSSSTLIKIDSDDTEYKIVNNELWLRSHTQILGYLNHSMDSFSKEGWFKTGDLVEETEDGFIKIVGRSKEVINVGGEKVLPAEIESCVLKVPGVIDCLAYALRNSITGQCVAIRVSSNEPDPKALKKNIKEFCRAHLDSFKIPVKIDIVQHIEFNQRFKKIRTKL